MSYFGIRISPSISPTAYFFIVHWQYLYLDDDDKATTEYYSYLSTGIEILILPQWVFRARPRFYSSRRRFHWMILFMYWSNIMPQGDDPNWQHVCGQRLSWKCRRHVGDMSATRDIVGKFRRHGLSLPTGRPCGTWLESIWHVGAPYYFTYPT